MRLSGGREGANLLVVRKDVWMEAQYLDLHMSMSALCLVPRPTLPLFPQSIASKKGSPLEAGLKLNTLHTHDSPPPFPSPAHGHNQRETTGILAQNKGCWHFPFTSHCCSQLSCLRTLLCPFLDNYAITSTKKTWELSGNPKPVLFLPKNWSIWAILLCL